MAERELYSGRYEILRHVARGGMAEVYMARDHLLDRPVALKVLFPEYARDESFVERFRREAKAAANLNHPNIVAVYDWGEEAGTYYIVMEYVEGLSLRELIRDEGTLLPERAAEIAADIAAALGYAHSHGVIHRDIKPGNVLITQHGQVKVTDFGIARAGAAEELTRTGMVMGTASYFSPEQAQGHSVDPRSDVYSLGVVLYEMVAGEPPFAGEDPVSIAYQHVREEPMPPGIKNPDVPLDLERVILTALTKAPGDRYPSAEDMRHDLVRFAQGQPVQSRPVTAVLADDDATMVSSAAASDQTAVVPATPAAVPPSPTRASDAERRRRRRAIAWSMAIVALLLLVAGLLWALADQLGIIGGGEEVVVPNVVGLPLEEARDELEALGLEVATEFEENDEVPENQVFRQDPEDGVRMEEGGTVQLVVSAGVGQVEVPDVVDNSLETARQKLDDAGFDVRVIEEFNDEVDEGRVIRTEPQAGSQAPEGSTITVYVSSGSEPVPVPDVVGDGEVEAAAALGREGFAVETVEEASDEVQEGSVIRTDPAAGTTAPKGSTVTIVVSSGPAPATVPDVIDSAPNEARSAIEAEELQPQEQTTIDCDLSEEGTVVRQSPEPGTEVEKGSTVTYFVCDFPGDGGDGGGGDGGGGDGGGGD